MSTDSQTLINTIKSGEMTDPGAMTTTGDIARVLSDSRETVERKLSELEREGAIESKTFGNERVWVVSEDNDESPSKTPMPTDTRDPVKN